MRKALAVLAMVMTLGLVTTMDAEAKRLGGGKSSGMNRQTTSAPANNTTSTPAQSPAAGAPATAAAAAPAAAAAAGKRSWMGPLAGLAAGIGLMALASHLGFGEQMANMMMIGLLVMVVLAAVAFFMRKRAAANGTPAMAGMGGLGNRGQEPGMLRTGLGDQQPAGPSAIGSRIGSNLIGGAPAAAAAIPADFDVAGFQRGAKENFMRLQAANDAGDLEALRSYLTPELFEEARAEIQARGNTTQQTQVFGLEAQVLEVVEEGSSYVVSVRFSGSVREQPHEAPEDLAEIWHLTKPRDGFGGWVIAGIQQA